MVSEKQFLIEIEKIKKVFSLDHDKISLKHSNEYAEDWNPEKKCYEIEYKIREINYYLIHEFGHILFANITKYPYFARTSLEIKMLNKEITKYFNEGKELPKELEDLINIFNYSNHLIDCFVNNSAFLGFKEYYQYYLNYMDELLQTISRGFRFTDLHDLLEGYIGFYLEFHYILKFKNRRVQQKKIDIFLKELKNIIVDNTEFTIQNFQKLNQKLKNFSIIKSIKEPKEIIKFINEIIKELSFWELKTIQDKFNIFFPDMDLSFLSE